MLSGFAPEDCIPFTGDAIRHPVRWTGGGTLPPAEPDQYRKLVFEIDNGEIFGFVTSD